MGGYFYTGSACGFDSSVSGYGSVADYSEHSNEPSGSIKGGTFLPLAVRELASQEALCAMALVCYFIISSRASPDPDPIPELVQSRFVP
jgi:hypothetical protein